MKLSDKMNKLIKKVSKNILSDYDKYCNNRQLCILFETNPDDPKEVKAEFFTVRHSFDPQKVILGGEWIDYTENYMKALINLEKNFDRWLKEYVPKKVSE